MKRVLPLFHKLPPTSFTPLYPRVISSSSLSSSSSCYILPNRLYASAAPAGKPSAKDNTKQSTPSPTPTPTPTPTSTSSPSPSPTSSPSSSTSETPIVKHSNIVKGYEYVSTPTFATTGTPMPCYRVMDQMGNILPGAKDPELGKEVALKMFRIMVMVNVMDSIMYDIQRQGRISFYMTSFGEEATHVGSAAGLSMDDIVFGQYREVGVLVWRGFTLDDIMNQCCSNQYDFGKGRQMPVHYGSKKHNFQTISSPLATQLPQAVGAAYSQKLAGSKNCVIVYFGEGAASEGDFHAAVNFAATLEVPVIFFCRNNKWAISTPSHEQYRGDGMAARGIAYGLHTIRVDGNDTWAVYNATVEARQIATTQNTPVMIEAMTYRIGHHSTSDDSTRYRTVEEVNMWKEKHNPITRLGHYLTQRGWWSEAQDKALVLECRQLVRDALGKAEKQLKPGIVHLFTDVYDTIPQHLLAQKNELEQHLKKYPDEYPIDQHSKSL